MEELERITAPGESEFASELERYRALEEIRDLRSRGYELPARWLLWEEQERKREEESDISRKFLQRHFPGSYDPVEELLQPIPGSAPLPDLYKMQEEEKRKKLYASLEVSGGDRVQRLLEIRDFLYQG
ncbi:MAG: hypothetical protein GWN86_07540, partial [Desulfobacterales bacterium]|nr:hypothetical protein [Desulfobacterales bacterium]